MKVGLSVSIIGHLAILGFGFIAFPEARPFAPELIEALPVELVPISEVTDVLAGDKNAEALPEERPQPREQVQAESPAPEPAEKPAEKPVEAAQRPAPPPPPPPPEPEVTPEPEPAPEQVAALPEPEPEPLPAEEPEPLPEAQPEPAKPVESRPPRARPEPLQERTVEIKPTPPDPEEQQRLRELTQADEPEEFSTDDIAALLDKREPAGGGDPVPADEPQTLGSIEGHAEAQMTQSELAALQARLYQCWNPPVGVREAGALVVTVRISLLQDGSLATAPQLLSVGAVSDPLATVAAESAIRAVAQCAPFGDILRPEKYALWREIDFVFDPRMMLGG